MPDFIYICHVLSHLKFTTHLCQLDRLGSRWSFTGAPCLWEGKGGKVGLGRQSSDHTADLTFIKCQVGRGEPHWPRCSLTPWPSGTLEQRLPTLQEGVSSWAEMVMPTSHWAQSLAGGLPRNIMILPQNPRGLLKVLRAEALPRAAQQCTSRRPQLGRFYNDPCFGESKMKHRGYVNFLKLHNQ